MIQHCIMYGLDVWAGTTILYKWFNGIIWRLFKIGCKVSIRVRRQPSQRGAWRRDRGRVEELADDLPWLGIRSHRLPSWRWRFCLHHRGKRKILWRRFRLHLRWLFALHFLILWCRSQSRNCLQIKTQLITINYSFTTLQSNPYEQD